MKIRHLSLLLLLIMCHYANAQAQLHGESSGHTRNLEAITSNDYWFALPQNYEMQSGKWIMLYVSSTSSTTAHIQCGSDSTETVDLTAGATASISVPLTWEMTTSGIAEDKGIHVWSEDAPLFVDVISHNVKTSDGTYVLPSSGWGTTYVVAAAPSLHEGSAPGYDYPSEFVVVADQDNTSIEITPSADLRGGDGVTVYPAHVMFTTHQDRGQAVQYKVVKSTTAALDASGTMIHSNNPVGLLAGSQCANIPNEYPYCDFVMEMIPPVRTWGSTYLTAPLFGKKQGSSHQIISTKPNQVVTRSTDSGVAASYTLGAAYSSLWVNDVDLTSKWSSDAPFFLAQYCNSSTYPVQGSEGDPFMMAINAVDQLSTPVMFNVPSVGGTRDAYVSSLNIVARSNQAIILDGTTLTATASYDDGTYAVYRVASVQPGMHTIASDSGLSVNICSKGSYESIGYAGYIGVSSINSIDSSAPHIDLSGNGTSMTIRAKDPGARRSGLSQASIVFATNMRLVPNTAFTPASGADSTAFVLQAIDSNEGGSATVRVYDLAGNFSTIDVTYEPTKVEAITVKNLNFGNVKRGSSLTLPTTISSTGTRDLNISSIQIDDPAFTIDTAVHYPLLLSAGEWKTLAVTYHADTLGDHNAQISVFTTEGISGIGTLLAHAITASVYSESRSATSDLISVSRAMPRDGSRVIEIDYSLSKEATVETALYDVLGRTVYAGTPEALSAGEHHFTYDGRLLPNGTYIYRFLTNMGAHSGKIVVSR